MFHHLVAAKNDAQEEWKISRDTVDRLDKTLIDLRKYGFTLITGLLTAGSFLGFSDTSRVAQVAVIIVTMVLVVVLYWLDTLYQSLLLGAVFRARYLEIFKVDVGLTNYISAFYAASRVEHLLHLLYVGFLVGALILGLFVAATAVSTLPLLPGTNIIELLKPLNLNSSQLNSLNSTLATISNKPPLLFLDGLWIYNTLVGGFLASIAGILLIYRYCTKRRNICVSEVRGLFMKYRNLERKYDDTKLLELKTALHNLLDKYEE